MNPLDDTTIGTVPDPITGPATDTIAPPDRSSHRRRRHPAVLAFAAVGISAAAVMTGASVSASTMPSPTPQQADVVTLGTMSGTGDGFECTFTGQDAAALDAAIRADGAAAVAMAEAAEGATAAGGADAPSVEAGGIPVQVSGPDAASGSEPVSGSVSVAGGDVIAPLPADGIEPSTETSGAVRAGTKAECDSLVRDATDGKR